MLSIILQVQLLYQVRAIISKTSLQKEMESEKYSVVKDGKEENHGGMSVASKELLLKSLQ